MTDTTPGCGSTTDARKRAQEKASTPGEREALEDEGLENALIEYDEDGRHFGTSGAGAFFLADHLLKSEWLAEHDDPPGWTTNAADALVYECQCGNQSPALDHDFIWPQDADNGGDWHRAHVAAEIARAVTDLLTSDRMREVVAETLPERHWCNSNYAKGCNCKTVRADDATAALAAIRTELEGASDE